MPLNERQQESYLLTCDIYRKPLSTTGGASGFAKGRQPATLLYSSVPFKLEMGKGVSNPAAIGLTDADQAMAYDRAFFTADDGYELGTNCFFVLTTAGHPHEGKWWAFLGEPNVVPTQGEREANYQLCQVKQTTDPR